MSLPDGRPCTSPSLLQPQSQPQSPLPVKQGFLRKLLARSASTRSTKSSASSVSADQRLAPEPVSSPGLIKRMSKRVVPGLPRAQTFKRQLSEDRKHLAPVEPSAEERRAASVDRRAHYPRKPSGRVSRNHIDPHSSAPSFLASLSTKLLPMHSHFPSTSLNLSQRMHRPTFRTPIRMIQI